MNIQKSEIEDNNTKSSQKKLKIILIIIGIALIFFAINSIYNTHKAEENYEAKGWQTATATCTEENSYTKTR